MTAPHTVAGHTAGPWGVSKRLANGTAAYVDCPAGYTVAQAYSSPSVKVAYRDLWAEAEANARLIAAAPDLLAALIVTQKEACGDWCMLGTHTASCDAARAAIAKATAARQSGEDA